MSRCTSVTLRSFQSPSTYSLARRRKRRSNAGELEAAGAETENELIARCPARLSVVPLGTPPSAGFPRTRRQRAGSRSTSRPFTRFAAATTGYLRFVDGHGELGDASVPLLRDLLAELPTSLVRRLRTQQGWASSSRCTRILKARVSIFLFRPTPIARRILEITRLDSVLRIDRLSAKLASA
jgi:hypothetical protein